MSWGKGIALVIVAFILWISFLVYKTTLVTSEMVTDNYYEKELKYEEVIQAKRNLQKLNEELVIQQRNDSVLITFPKEFDATSRGEIYFYRPSNPKQDKTFPIDLTHTSTQVITKNNLTRGVYQIQVSWNQNSTPYFFEQTLFIE